MTSRKRKANAVKCGVLGAAILCGVCAGASASETNVADSVLAAERAELAKNTEGRGFGPQSPRDIENAAGQNHQIFGTAPERSEMNLCNIHFHENAEHRGGDFTTYAGNGDGEGNATGFKYNGTLTESELKPIAVPIGVSEHGDLVPGDTIEVHYVYSTADIEPGPTLHYCLNEETSNPQLRVEAQVYVLVNDENALDFNTLTKLGKENGYHQALGIPNDAGTPVEYAGSTTGPGYNEEASPFEVTWSVYPEVQKVDINSVGEWLGHNVFDEDHAHGVRNLVVNPDLLSEIKK